MEATRGCSEAVRGPYEGAKPERPRYFPRQLITPEEMNLEQAYFRDRMRRHNRLLHGWGVVCGAEVCPVPSPDASGYEEWRAGSHTHAGSGSRPYTASGSPPHASSEPGSGFGPGGRPDHDPCDPCAGWDPWRILVQPGYILGPFGDEIMIGSRVIVDLRQRCTSGVSDDCWSQAPDPWCSDAKLTSLESPLYVAVRYKEIMTRPVRVPPPGCGCDDLECEYSRWCDGYEICTLTECPDSHRGMPIEEPELLPHCPPCPDEPWVVLAEVEFDPETGCVTRIDNCSCRRLVRSDACYWWRCGDEIREIEPREREEREERAREEREAIDGRGAEPAIRHVGGGWFEVEGFDRRVRSRENALVVARALAEGRDPLEAVDLDALTLNVNG